MQKYKGKPGQHIADAAQCAIDLARVGAPVELEFNEVLLNCAVGMAAGDVVAEYHRQVDARHAAYIKTPEYKERERLAEEHGRQRARELADALAKAPAEMTLKAASAWAESRKNNTDPYGDAIIRYAETWARLMEGAVSSGETIVACAQRTSQLADTEGITGFMYGAAVGILSAVWVHGDELRRWHNWAYGVTEEKAKGGTVNPAVIRVG